MKRIRQICLGWIVLCSSNILFGAQEVSLDHNALEQRAKEFLNILSVENPAAALNQAEFISFLNERVSNVARIKAGENALAKKELKILDSQWCFLFTMNYIDTDPNARVVYYYPKMAEENFAFMLRKKLQCRVGNLTEFEKTYENMLEEVSSEEFGKRLGAISDVELDILRLQCSQDFAIAILKEKQVSLSIYSSIKSFL